MSIKNLPKSLIDSVIEVVTDSNDKQAKLFDKIVSEGMKKFGIKDVSTISEEELKALYAWTQIKLTESSCSCGHDLSEDDMPGDSVYHKNDDENAAKKKEIDEDEKANKDHDGDGEVETSSQEYLGARDKAIKSAMKETTYNDSVKEGRMPSAVIKHKQKLAHMPDAEFAKLYSHMNDEKLKSMAWGHGYGKDSLQYVNKMLRGKNELNKLKITENVAIAPHELATNGAVGVTDPTTQMPIHADVLKDSNPVDGSHEYRLFVQFNTNGLPVIIPSPVLPGAPTVDALREIVEGLPYFGDTIERALQTASQEITVSDS